MASTDPGSEVRIDTDEASAALRLLEPMITEVESALDEVDQIADQVRGDCAAHPSGAVFGVGHRHLADASSVALEQLRLALSGYVDDVRRATVHLTAADAENAESLRASTGGAG